MKKWIQNRYKQLRTLKQAKQINKIDLTIKTVEKKGKYFGLQSEIWISDKTNHVCVLWLERKAYFNILKRLMAILLFNRV